MNRIIASLDVPQVSVATQIVARTKRAIVHPMYSFGVESEFLRLRRIWIDSPNTMA